MIVDFAFLCDFAEVTGKINALGIGFETIFAKQLPAMHPHFCLVLQLRTSSVEAGQKKIQVNLIDEDGKDVIPQVNGQINMKKQDGGAPSIGRFVLEFGGIQFKQYGAYSVKVVIENEEKVSIPFCVSSPPTTA